LTILLPFAGAGIYELLGFHLPWSIDIAMFVYPFYFIGFKMRTSGIDSFISKKFSIFLAVLFFIIHFTGVYLNDQVYFYYGEYSNFYLTLINGVSGFLWAWFVFRLLPANRVIEWVGKNTLSLLAFHLLAMTVIKGIAHYVFQTSIEFNALNSLLLAIVQIILLIIPIMLINRYFPFLLGIRRKKDLVVYSDKLN
jgi:acyltransferase